MLARVTKYLPLLYNLTLTLYCTDMHIDMDNHKEHKRIQAELKIICGKKTVANQGQIIIFCFETPEALVGLLRAMLSASMKFLPLSMRGAKNRTYRKYNNAWHLYRFKRPSAARKPLPASMDPMRTRYDTGEHEQSWRVRYREGTAMCCLPCSSIRSSNYFDIGFLMTMTWLWPERYIRKPEKPWNQVLQARIIAVLKNEWARKDQPLISQVMQAWLAFPYVNISFSTWATMLNDQKTSNVKMGYRFIHRVTVYK